MRNNLSYFYGVLIISLCTLFACSEEETARGLMPHQDQFVVAATDRITGVSTDYVVVPGTTETVTVGYEATQAREVKVIFQQEGGASTYATDVIQVAAGAGELTATLSIPADVPLAEDAYQLAVFITPVGKDYAERLGDNTERDVSVRTTDVALTDAVVSITADDIIVAGTQEDVTVAYEASQNRKLELVLQDAGGKTTYTAQPTQVTAGAGEVTVTLNVPDDIPPAEAGYKYAAFLTTPDGNYSNRVADHLNRSGITAVDEEPDGGPVTDAELVWEADLDAVGTKGYKSVKLSDLEAVFGGARFADGNAVSAHLSFGTDQYGDYMEQRYAPTGGGSDVVQFAIPVAGTYDELWVGFDFVLMTRALDGTKTDWTFNDAYRGLKFGFGMGSGDRFHNYSGGTDARPGDKFNMRWMIREASQINAPGQHRLQAYTYYHRMNSRYGQDDFTDGPNLQRGQYYRAAMGIKMRGAADGKDLITLVVIQNGNRYETRFGLDLMTTNDGIESLIYSSFRGGRDPSWAEPLSYARLYHPRAAVSFDKLGWE